ncbi:PadR family transcriptional regulator [Geoalkalibacter halelectricus]|uniref:PadR family transcriptional regulator n=1 Tax=Geoalkalibacter halelectricus TaxID=2847045 RepID=A0ABY5ZGJ5_9BACT|nr:PadR family transcriptional regulator [Geoalkalibacter halelectricus]MDO3380174.1 PadR family transcriptional regulator [Geoalkalibacter halelectricus]UWZ78252.1 PadR family transcriptional regulator [Geoalkalibacter halelectricus]
MNLTAEDFKILNREVLLGFWKVHILHHAAQGPLVGQWMLTELRHHGYEVSPGTLYPMLQRMESNGWLHSEVDPQRGPKAPRKYYLTPKGREILAYISGQVDELARELKEENHRDSCQYQPSK